MYPCPGDTRIYDIARCTTGESPSSRAQSSRRRPSCRPSLAPRAVRVRPGRSRERPEQPTATRSALARMRVTTPGGVGLRERKHGEDCEDATLTGPDVAVPEAGAGRRDGRSLSVDGATQRASPRTLTPQTPSDVAARPLQTSQQPRAAPCRARSLQTAPSTRPLSRHRSRKTATRWQRFLSGLPGVPRRPRDRRLGLRKAGPVDGTGGQAAQLPPRDEIALRVGLRPPWRGLCGRAADLCEAVVLVPGRDAVDGDVGHRLRIEVRGSRVSRSGP